MSARHRRRSVALGVLLAGAAAAGLGVGSSSRGADAAAPVAPAQVLAARPPVTAAAETPVVASFHMAPLETYGEVLRRPLFAPDRRAHEAAQTAALPQSFTLQGIVVQPAAAYALVEEGTATRRVTEGQALGGGTVKQILRDRVVLNVNGVDTPVKLFDPTAKDKSTPGLPPAGGISSQMPPDHHASVPTSRPH